MGLPDLDTESGEVKSFFLDWLRKEILTKYGFDGLRIDTVKHVGKPFWDEINFVLNTRGSFAIGEVMHSELPYVADYQNHMHSLMDYPLYYEIVDVFGKQALPISSLIQTLKKSNSIFASTPLLGVFIDNHDVSRFPNFL